MTRWDNLNHHVRNVLVEHQRQPRETTAQRVYSYRDAFGVDAEVAEAIKVAEVCDDAVREAERRFNEARMALADTLVRKYEVSDRVKPVQARLIGSVGGYHVDIAVSGSLEVLGRAIRDSAVNEKGEHVVDIRALTPRDVMSELKRMAAEAIPFVPGESVAGSASWDVGPSIPIAPRVEWAIANISLLSDTEIDERMYPDDAAIAKQSKRAGILNFYYPTVKCWGVWFLGNSHATAGWGRFDGGVVDASPDRELAQAAVNYWNKCAGAGIGSLASNAYELRPYAPVKP